MGIYGFDIHHVNKSEPLLEEKEDSGSLLKLDCFISQASSRKQITVSRSLQKGLKKKRGYSKE